MADQSNLYGKELMGSITELSQHSHLQKAVKIILGDMKAYVALQIAMGIYFKPEQEDYWRTYWLTKVQFGSAMSKNRFELIPKFLRFADNTTHVERGQAGRDPLFKITPLLDITVSLYTTVYSLSRQLSTDESMIKFKGRIFFHKFLPSKPT